MSVQTETNGQHAEIDDLLAVPSYTRGQYKRGPFVALPSISKWHYKRRPFVVKTVYTESQYKRRQTEIF